MDDKQYANGPTPNPRDRGRAWAGLVFLLIGGVLLLKQFGLLLPHWIYSWPMLIIVIGLVVGAKHNFRDIGWVVMVGIGALFLAEEIHPEMDIHHFIWPVVIIGVGLMLIFRPQGRRRSRWQEKRQLYPDENPTVQDSYTPPASDVTDRGEDIIDVVSIFGNVRKMILSKSFKGGETVCIFGGCEINMLQADISQTIVIDSVNIFGGTKLVIPSHWQVRSEAVAIFGGVEDKRQQPAGNDLHSGKVLILKGAALFGGIEITSY